MESNGFNLIDSFKFQERERASNFRITHTRYKCGLYHHFIPWEEWLWADIDVTMHEIWEKIQILRAFTKPLQIDFQRISFSPFHAMILSSWTDIIASLRYEHIQGRNSRRWSFKSEEREKWLTSGILQAWCSSMIFESASDLLWLFCASDLYPKLSCIETWLHQYHLKGIKIILNRMVYLEDFFSCYSLEDQMFWSATHNSLSYSLFRFSENAVSAVYRWNVRTVDSDYMTANHFWSNEYIASNAIKMSLLNLRRLAVLFAWDLPSQIRKRVLFGLKIQEKFSSFQTWTFLEDIEQPKRSPWAQDQCRLLCSRRAHSQQIESNA